MVEREQAGDSESVTQGNPQGSTTTTENRVEESVGETQETEKVLQGDESQDTAGEIREQVDSQQANQSANQTGEDSVNTGFENVTQAWNKLFLYPQVEFTMLPEQQQEEFTQLFNKGLLGSKKKRNPYQIAEQIYLNAKDTMLEMDRKDSKFGPTALFDISKQILEEDVGAMNTNERTTEAIEDIIMLAHFDGAKDVNKAAATYLSISTGKFSDAQQDLINDKFIESIIAYGVEGKTLESANINQPEGTPQREKRWVSFAEEQGLFEALISKGVNIINLPERLSQYGTIDPSLPGETDGGRLRTTLPGTNKDISMEEKFENILDKIKKGYSKGKSLSSGKIQELIELRDKVDINYELDRDRGNGTNEQIKDYFKDNGTGDLKYLKDADGFIRPITVEQTDADKKIQQDRIRANKLAKLKVGKIKSETIPSPNHLLDDNPKGRLQRFDTGKEIGAPIPQGKIKLIVNQLLKKLKIKPTVTIVKNVQDLKDNNPKLYKLANEGRPDGDFDTTPAIGYSIGDQIIIFSDYAMTEDSVKFVIGHETLGHFGFSAFMPKARLNAILRAAYREDSNIKLSADMNIVSGMEFHEAIEEVLADHAVHAVEITTIGKIWNGVGSFLGRIFNPGSMEGMEEYLIKQSRRNISRGNFGVVSVPQIQANLLELNDYGARGRYYAAQNSTNLMTKLHASLSQTYNRITNADSDAVKKVQDYVDKATKKIKGLKKSERNPQTFTQIVKETLQSLDNKATRSEGLSHIFRIFQDQTGRVRRLQQEYAELTKFTHGSGILAARSTEQERQQAGELLAYGAIYKLRQLDAAKIRDAKDLTAYNGEGELIINPNALAELAQVGIVSREQFMEGLPVELEGDLGVPGGLYRPSFSITDNVYKVYMEQRNAVNQAAVDVLEANLQATVQQRKDTIENFKTFAGVDNQLPTDLDLQTIKDIMEEYKKIYLEDAVETDSGIEYPNSDKAIEFIAQINRALHKDLKVADWKAGKDVANETQQFKNIENLDSIVQGLERLNKLYNNPDAGNTNSLTKSAYKITDGIQDMFDLDIRNQNAEANAKRTIMGAYVPFNREGAYQVQINAYDRTGNRVEIPAHFKTSLPYYQVDSFKSADEIRDRLEEQFGNLQSFKLDDGTGVMQEVTLRAESSIAPNVAPLTANQISLNEVDNVLKRLGIPIAPAGRKKLVLALADQGKKARSYLERANVEGWDTNVIQKISQHLETETHRAGKAFYMYKVDSIMLDTKMWRGDDRKLKQLRDKMELAEKQGNINRLLEAQSLYDRYAYKYLHMRDKAANNTVRIYKGKGFNRKSELKQTLGIGEVYRTDAAELQQFYADAANIDVNTEDEILGKTPGTVLKLATVTTQLGGSFATGIINMVSMITHSIPYLATYNSKSGFGGGFGLVNAAKEMTTAVANMSDLTQQVKSSIRTEKTALSNIDYVRKVKASKALQKKHNITQNEADALEVATAQGVLQAAQFNALVGSARGGLQANPRAAAAIRTWMSIFSYTEQLNRRATFLAAYRLQQKKLLDAGQSVEDAKQNSILFATDAVNKSQGEYGMYNRPKMARGRFLQYIFMYKQFVIITIQLMASLAPKEQIAMIGLLILFTGMKGIPFSEDFGDLIDTLFQKLEIKMQPVEKEIDDIAESLGISPIIIQRGITDYFLGGTVSTRLGFSDLIPLTGSFKAGASFQREAENFFGPVYSAMSGISGFITGTLRQIPEAAGLLEDTSFEKVIRKAPLSGIKGLVEAGIFYKDGKITNSDGKIITHDVTTSEIIMRALNFYPARSTYTYDIVRMVKQRDAYRKELSTRYVNQMVRAQIDNDNEEMNRVLRNVEEFNVNAEGTGLEIRNFGTKVRRAYQAFTQPVSKELLKYSARQDKLEIRRMMEAYGLDSDDLE